MKRKDARIYVLSHKAVDYGLLDNNLYTPLECGAALRSEHCATVKDSVGEGNISEWNGLFAELTGIWHAWKIAAPKSLKYVGFCQYRRRLEFAEDTDFAALFSSAPIITAEPQNLYMLLEDQYRNCHCFDDLKACEEVVAELYPEYVDDWDYVFRHNTRIFYSNGWIMPREEFEKYCTWLFSILEALKIRLGFNSMADVQEHVEKNIEQHKSSSARGVKYQMQIFGFLSERLFTLYVMHNYDKVMTVPYHKMENQF